MKNPIQLYLDNQRVDISPDEGVVLQKKILDQSGFSDFVTEFSREFTIPCSDNNNKVLRHYEDKDNTGIFNPNKVISARLDLEGLIAIEGSVEMLSVTWKYGQPEFYKIVFYGRSSGLKAEMGDTLLSDLDMSEFFFIINETNVMDSWEINTLPEDDTNYFTPIISWERWMTWYETGVTTGDDGNINEDGKGVRLGELRVGILLKDLIELCGRTFDVTFLWDDKIGTHLDQAFIVPSRVADRYKYFDESFYDVDVEIEDPVYVGSGNTWSPIFMQQINKDLSGSWINDGSHYSPPFSGTYEFQIDFSGDKCRRQYSLYRDDGGLVQSLGTANVDSGSITLGGALEVGRTYYFAMEPNKSTTEDITRMRTTSIPISVYGLEWTAEDFFPIMKVSEFFSGFLRAFNCSLRATQNEREYTIIDFMSMYEDQGVADLGQFADTSMITYEKVRVYSSINYRHKEGADAPNTLFAQSAGRQYAQEIFIPDVDFSSGELDRESIFTSFPPQRISRYTWSDTTESRSYAGATDLWHHHNLTSDEPPKPVLAQFLIMYRNGSEETNYPYLLQDGDDAGGNPTFGRITTMGLYSQVQDVFSLETSKSLTYSLETPQQGNIPLRDLLSEFSLEWLVQLYKKTAYTITISFPTGFGTFQRITAQSALYFKGFYHFLAAWQYDSGTGILKLNLLRFDRIRFDPNFVVHEDIQVDQDAVNVIHSSAGGGVTYIRLTDGTSRLITN